MTLAVLLPAVATLATLEVPELRGRVNDLAGLLDPGRARALDARLARFEEETSHQVVLLTVPSLQGEPIEEFALRVAESWRIGHAGLDNGAILVVVPEDRKARIEVGYGLEGVVPDVVAKRILEDVLFPSFRQGRMAEGIEAGVDALMSAARAERIELDRRPERRPAGGSELPLSEVFLASIVGTLVAAPFRSGRRALPGALIAGLVAGGLTYLLVRALPWALLAFGVGALLVWLGVIGAAGRHGSGWTGFGSGGRFGGGFGGGFSGGGGGFGGGGASGSW